jgi:hypothetical protein
MLQYGSSSSLQSSGKFGINDLSESRQGRVIKGGTEEGERRKILMQSLAATSLLKALVKTQTKTSADTVSFLQLNIWLGLIWCYHFPCTILVPVHHFSGFHLCPNPLG